MGEQEDWQVHVRLARLEENLKSLDRLVDVIREDEDEARKLAAMEYARRFEHLNGETARMDKLHAEMVRREMFDSRMGAIDQRVTMVEGEARETRGKLWLPMILIAAIAAGLAAAAVRLLIP